MAELRMLGKSDIASKQMCRNLTCAAVFLLFSSTLQAWDARDPLQLSGQGVEYVLARFQEPARSLSCEIQLTLFNARTHDLRVLDDPDGKAGNLGAAATSSGWISGVNGGYFHPDNRPLGLVVSNGTVIHPLQSARLLSGIVASNQSQIFLLRPPEFRLGSSTRQALQAGPFLVDQRRVVPGLEATRRARRTIVATDGGSRWAIGTLGPLSLAEAGSLLSSEAFASVAFPIHRALNLDGGSSSAYYFQPDSGRPIYVRELTRVRNYLGVVRREKTSH